MKTPIQKIIGIAGTWLVVATASAQNYNIDWFTIDGGGGTSTSAGGVFAISGTIGQPNAGGPMAGGNYSLTGGFWSVVAAIQTPDEPVLTITRDVVSGAVTVSWDATPAGFVLEQTGALTGTPAVSWTQVPFPYQASAGRIFISEPSPAGNRFYRLRKP